MASRGYYHDEPPPDDGYYDEPPPEGGEDEYADGEGYAEDDEGPRIVPPTDARAAAILDGFRMCAHVRACGPHFSPGLHAHFAERAFACASRKIFPTLLAATG